MKRILDGVRASLDVIGLVGGALIFAGFILMMALR
jgi:hypothetical protein